MGGFPVDGALVGAGSLSPWGLGLMASSNQVK
jgi:hypothetical protein